MYFFHLHGSEQLFVRDSVSTNWTTSSSTLTFSDINDIPTGTLITVRHTQDNYLILDRTDLSGSDIGHKLSQIQRLKNEMTHISRGQMLETL